MNYFFKRASKEKVLLKRELISSLALYDGQPRSKEELYKQAGELVQRFVQGQPQTDMAIEILNLSSELKDVDPIFNKLFLFKYPVELNDLPREEFVRNFINWAVEEGLAPAEEEEQLATEFEDLVILNGLLTKLCADYHLIIPTMTINVSGEVYYLFDDTDAAGGESHLVVKIDFFKNETLQAIQPDTQGWVPMCMALIDSNEILDFVITTKMVIPKDPPPSDIELAITEEPGNDCWTVYSDETQDFYDFHAKSQIQAAQVRRARSGDTTFTAHGFAYNPYTGYYEADYLDGID